MALGLDKLEAIRRQGIENDWTAEIVESATLDDLDPAAIDYAREGFIQKHQREFKREEVLGWSLSAFLDRAQLTRNGRVTRTGLLLVGKELSAGLLSPFPAQLVWKLVGEENANDIFYPPFLLTTRKLKDRIRNVQVRILPEGHLVPVEVPKYLDESILEAVHNCIAHQDYRQNGRVVVTEYVDRLTFANLGGFFDGKPEEYIKGDKMPNRYRNLQLVKAMREINMIDTMGYGIHRLYNWQVERYFPLPDYKHDAHSVELTIYGHVVDLAYSSLLLLKRGDLKLDDVCLLDRVQKKLRIDSRAVAHLRREGLIEGRLPNVHVSAKIASMTGKEADYIKNRQKPSKHYHSLILDYLEKFESATREKIDELLLDEIRGNLEFEQKLQKISNILSYLRINKKIANVGTKHDPIWVLCKETEKSR